MTQSTSTPYDWLKKIPDALAELDEIPLLGNAPDFPWENFTKKIGQTFELQDLQITPSSFVWRDVHELFSGLGSPLLPLNFTLPPFEGRLYWAMSKQDAKELCLSACVKNPPENLILDDPFLEGLYLFLAAEALDTIEKLPYPLAKNPQLLQDPALPDQPMLTLDAAISLQGKSATARLFLPPALRQSIAKHYRKLGQEAPLKSPLAETLDVILHLEAGSVSLSEKEWLTIQPGDFLVLEHCTLQPGSKNGNLMLTYRGQPFFKGALKDGSIEILEHPLYYEVNPAMDKRRPDEDEEFEDEESEEEFEDEETEEETEEEDTEEEFEEEESEEESEEEEEKAETEDNNVLDTAKAHAPANEKKFASPLDIPFNLIVEAGRVQVSVKTLMELKPGNLLQLNVHPESGVDLVINGSKVGKGELLQIGETLGVRILEIC